MSMEQWKPVIGWEGIYEVSDCGRIRCVRRKLGAQFMVPKTGCRSHGYMKVQLRDHPVYKKTYVHILVCKAFLGEPPTKKHVVNHKDGYGTNNALSNLEYMTRPENAIHAFRVLKRPTARGEKHAHAVLTEAEVREIRATPKTYGGNIVMAKKYGVGRSAIGFVRCGYSWTHVV